MQTTTSAQQIVAFTREELLDHLVEGVQLSRTQHDNATRAYRHVGGWLCDPNGLLARFKPAFEPQGSFVLGTVVRPLFQHESDLDALCVLALDPYRVDADTAMALMELRLKDHADLGARLERLARCLRLTYAGDFHLDNTPACVDPETGLLLVPAKTQERVDGSPRSSWKLTDPRGYALWFARRCAQASKELLNASVSPPPSYIPVAQKLPLQKFVQLIKARRNEHYEPDEAPASILLTTMAAEAYRGGAFTLDGLIEVVGAMTARAELGGSGLTVPNPTIPEENLAAPLGTRGKQRLAAFLRKHHHELIALRHAEGISEARRSLGTMYGERPADHAVKSYSDTLVEAKDGGRLHTLRNGAGLAAIVGAVPRVALAKPNRTHNFHGGRCAHVGYEARRVLSLDRQAAIVNATYRGLRARVGPGGLVVRGVIRPTPVSRAYTVRIVYRTGSMPMVYVETPLQRNARGEAPPHRYSNVGRPLCLFYPKGREWGSRDSIAETTIPWAAEWLAFYEIWLATNEWRGGGVDHAPGSAREAA